jgi:hypothetical protein
MAQVNEAHTNAKSLIKETLENIQHGKLWFIDIHLNKNSFNFLLTLKVFEKNSLRIKKLEKNEQETKKSMQKMKATIEQLNYESAFFKYMKIMFEVRKKNL